RISVDGSARRDVGNSRQHFRMHGGSLQQPGDGGERSGEKAAPAQHRGRDSNATGRRWPRRGDPLAVPEYVAGMDVAANKKATFYAKRRAKGRFSAPASSAPGTRASVPRPSP